ncbi:helix-turn-helix transcriptional regulator [Streptomyces sp. VB1]|uniref:helix-turn-helix transcriptional regulator n=1 Tax=Streptomyces sp. VB1 TaxID=2986803 RepID=UPI002242249A|nr:LuxR C-terminal-related transcriptional regulator [Streptomyces sp. VB1]UZI32795.1 LuxR C-terminal-related transcriptional regulator [Streptomyces sp. VB1]
MTRFEQLTGGRDLPAAHAELLLCQALIAMADAPGTAASRCDEAAEAFRRIGRPYESLRATERALRLRASSAPSDDSISGLSDTADAYAVLGAEHDAARCRHALRVLGHVQPNRRGRRGYGSALSPRERQVARYLTEGVGNREIAQALFPSPRTVEHHVASVLRKLGLPHRDALKGRLLDDP